MKSNQFTIDDIVGFLSSMELFSQLERPLLFEIQKKSEFVHLRGGEYLLRQGERGEDLYFVVSGRLRYSRNRDDREEVLAEVRRGDIVGEMAVFTGEPYFATVQAVRDCYLLKLSGLSFITLLERHPQTMIRITRILINRMRRAFESIPMSNRLSTIGIFSLLEGEKKRVFINNLLEALGHHGSTLLLDSNYIEKVLSRDYVSAPRHSHEGMVLVRWLTMQESEYDFILFDLDPLEEEWTRRSLRQTDLVLVVAESDDDPTFREIEKKYLIHEAHPVRAVRHLVLLHPDREALPQKTALWVEERSPNMHHHLVASDLEDFRRLARILTGNGVSLVLGGGGARGLAHLGVVRALREGGIPIDMVGGASMGAILGAQVAALWDSHRMFETTKEYMREGKGVMDYTLPLVSFLAGQRLSESMKNLSEGRDLEDLWLPYFCTTSNLNTGEVDVHRRGLLWKVARATSSLPAIFPPVRLGDHWHVDGGVLNNLPTDIMRQLNPKGKILAVDVSLDKEFIYRDQSDPALSGWYVLWRKLNPFAPTMSVPNIVHILMRSIELQSLSSREKIRERSRIDLYIRPPVQDFAMLDFKNLEAIAERGYQYAMEHMEEWKKGLGLLGC